ncbi:MAG: amino acid ABC transporter ATP-binding protein [Myxococcota bacterium]
MISIRGLHKAYKARSVLKGIDADVRAGSVIALVGGSGSGKSTLLRCLNALETFDAGSIEVAGHKLLPGPARGALDKLRSDVGMLFQDYQLFPHLSVLDNVTLAPRVVRKLPRSEAEQIALTWLERVGLAERAASRPSELSGGQKQRVALARALSQGVRVLLLDEPTSALDPEMRAEVADVLGRLVRGDAAEQLTMLLVTHDVRLATELADELWVLDAGTLVERGAPAEITRSPKSRVAREYFSLSSAD